MGEIDRHIDRIVYDLHRLTQEEITIVEHGTAMGQREIRGEFMTVQESLGKVLATLPEPRQREVLDFAEFLSWREEQTAWREFGRAQFARAYGVNEPDYTSADLKPELKT